MFSTRQVRRETGALSGRIGQRQRPGCAREAVENAQCPNFSRCFHCIQAAGAPQVGVRRECRTTRVHMRLASSLAAAFAALTARAGKRFFFEKKNQKTFSNGLRNLAQATQPDSRPHLQKFFGSFFQKRTAFFLSAL